MKGKVSLRSVHASTGRLLRRPACRQVPAVTAVAGEPAVVFVSTCSAGATMHAGRTQRSWWSPCSLHSLRSLRWLALVLVVAGVAACLLLAAGAENGDAVGFGGGASGSRVVPGVEPLSRQAVPRVSGTSPSIYIHGDLDLAIYFSGNPEMDGSPDKPYVFEDLVINASGAVWAGIFIADTTSHVIIRNCTVTSGRPNDIFGIFPYNAENIRVENCTLIDNEVGILLEDCRNCTVVGNNATDNNIAGIRSYNTRELVVAWNYMSNNSQDGLYLVVCPGANVTGNIAEYNRMHGINIQACDGVNVSGNQAFHNEQYGFYIGGLSNATITGNIGYYCIDGFHVESVNGAVFDGNDGSITGTGFYVVYSSSCNFTGNNATGNGVNGMWMEHSSNCTMTGNQVTGNNVGIKLIMAPGCSVLDNNISGNAMNGIAGYTSPNLTVSGNEMNGNSYDGIYLIDSGNSTISNNSIKNSGHIGMDIERSGNSTIQDNDIVWTVYFGIFIFSSGNSTIEHNLVSENTFYGIALSNSSFSDISRNNVTITGRVGIEISSSRNCTVTFNHVAKCNYMAIAIFEDTEGTVIYMNNFVDSGKWQAQEILAQGVQWDDGNGLGNFYSDYAERYPDATTTNNVTWDTPYETGNGMDRYPLVRQLWIPRATFTANTTPAVVEGDLVRFEFDGSISDPPANFTWDFGDGSPPVFTTNESLALVHGFPDEGVYTVNLTVVEADGDRDSKTMEVLVQKDVAPGATFIVDSFEVVQGEVLEFSFTGAIGNGFLQLTWDFGDGSPPVVTTDPGTNVTHLYNVAPGEYNFTLVVVDVDGDVATSGATINVLEDLQPLADFYFDYIKIENGTYIVDGPLVDFWFNGTTGNEPSEIEWYITYLTYPIRERDTFFSFYPHTRENLTLTVTDFDGDVSTKTVSLEWRPPPEVPGYPPALVWLAIVPGALAGCAAATRAQGGACRKRRRAPVKPGPQGFRPGGAGDAPAAIRPA